jgi:hypothetical protein
MQGHRRSSGGDSPIVMNRTWLGCALKWESVFHRGPSMSMLSGWSPVSTVSIIQDSICPGVMKLYVVTQV